MFLNFSGGEIIMKKVIIFTVVCMMFFLFPVYAKKNKENLRETEPQVEKEKSVKKIINEWVDIKIITPEKEIIKKYYIYNQQDCLKGGKDKKKALPPGLQKKLARGGDLPPGWQKKVIRGEVLDAEIYKYAVHVPYDLIKRLPPQPKGTVLIKVEGKIVRLLEATGTILDVFDLI
jgi:hypothetical protein